MMNLKLKQRYIPSGYELSKGNDSAVVYYKMEQGFYAVGFKGKAFKSAFHYRFLSQEKMDLYMDKFLKQSAESDSNKEKKKAEQKALQAALKASDFYKVGDILYYSWGYDQTNIDFFQVVEVGAKSVKVREIGGESFSREGYSPMSGFMKATKDKFVDDKILMKRVNPNGYINMKHGGLSKWDGKELYYSWYA